MERVNAWLGRHLWVQVVLSVLVASVLIAVVFPGRSLLSVVVRTAAVSVGGIAVMVRARRGERRAAGGSTDTVLSLDRRLRRGDVPADPGERQAMRALVEHRLQRTRHRVPAQICLALMACALVVATALTAGPRQTIGIAVLSVAFVGWCVRYGNRRHRRLRAMRQALSADVNDAKNARNADEAGSDHDAGRWPGSDAA